MNMSRGKRNFIYGIFALHLRGMSAAFSVNSPGRNRNDRHNRNHDNSRPSRSNPTGMAALCSEM